MKKLFGVFAMTLTGVVAMCLWACGETGGETLSLAPTRLTFDSGGGVKSVDVRGAQWSASVNADWVTIDPSAGTDGIINVTVAANETGEARYATLTVSNAAGSQTVSIEQVTPSDITVDPQSLDFGFAGEQKSVSVTSLPTWEVTSSDPEWLKVEKTADDGFTAKASPNNGAARNAVITVDNGAATKTIAVTQAESYGEAFIRVSADYYGQGFGPETGNFFLWFVNCPTDVIGNPAGAGYIAKVDIISRRPEDKPKLEIAPGTYTYSTGNEIMTITTWSGYEIINDDLSRSYKNIVDATLTVEGDHRNYIMKLDLLLDDGTRFKGYYAGPSITYNPAYLTTLEEDIDTEIGGVEGTLRFAGDLYDTGTAYTWLLDMNSPGVSMAPEGYYVGDGHILQGQFSAQMVGGGAYLPDDTYTITESQAVPGTAIAGNINYYTRQPNGGWIFILEDDVLMSRAPFVAGSITSSHSGDSYTFETDCLDDYGNSITATFTGEPTVAPYVVAASLTPLVGNERNVDDKSTNNAPVNGFVSPVK